MVHIKIIDRWKQWWRLLFKSFLCVITCQRILCLSTHLFLIYYSCFTDEETEEKRSKAKSILAQGYTESGTGILVPACILPRGYVCRLQRASLMAQTVKICLKETWVWSLEKGMSTHVSILAWWIPWTEEPGRLQFLGSQRVRHDWATNTHTINLI